MSWLENREESGPDSTHAKRSRKKGQLAESHVVTGEGRVKAEDLCGTQIA